MDSNGYNKNLFESEENRCFWCKSHRQTVRHEVFYGVAYRNSAKRLGLWVNLCTHCHYLIHNSGSGKKKTEKWREQGEMLLVDILSEYISEDKARELVDRYKKGNLKHWELEEMEKMYEQYWRSRTC